MSRELLSYEKTSVLITVTLTFDPENGYNLDFMWFAHLLQGNVSNLPSLIL